jgi:translocation and assembly module TamA
MPGFERGCVGKGMNAGRRQRPAERWRVAVPRHLVALVTAALALALAGIMLLASGRAQAQALAAPKPIQAASAVSVSSPTSAPAAASDSPARAAPGSPPASAAESAEPPEVDSDTAAPLPAGAASGAASAPRADRGKPIVWRLDIQAPAPLDRLLRSYLDLARFQEESSKDASLNIRRSELRRLVVSAPEQAQALLEAQGYFNAKITTRVGDEVPGQPILVSIQVDPGPLTTVSHVQFVF